MKKFYFSFLILFFTLLAFSCSMNPLDDLSRMGITDAEALFIAPAASSRNARSTTAELSNTLFKVTIDGEIIEVPLYDEGDSEISVTYEPEAIYNVNSDYVIIAFSGFSYDQFLVRKSDGAVYRLDSDEKRESYGISSWEGYPYINSSGVQTDGSGNCYFATIGSVFSSDYNISIDKINLSNPSLITRSTITSDVEDIDSFVVSPSGDFGYFFDDGASNGGRIRTSSGSLTNVVGKSFVWIGLDDQIKFTSDLYSYDTYLFMFTERTVAVRVGGNNISELENPSDTPREFSLSSEGIENITIADASDDYYYLCGKDNSANTLIQRVDPADDSVTTILSGGLYDVYKMSVSADDTILFNALRMSDGAKIIGEISFGGTVTILDENLDTTMTVLERIN